MVSPRFNWLLFLVLTLLFFGRNKFNFIQSGDLLLRERVNKVRIFVLVAINSSAAFAFFVVVPLLLSRQKESMIELKTFLTIFFPSSPFLFDAQRKRNKFRVCFVSLTLDWTRKQKTNGERCKYVLQYGDERSDRARIQRHTHTHERLNGATIWNASEWIVRARLVHKICS